MTNIFVVRYVDLDDDGVICAFTSKEEAIRYAQLLEDEKEEDDSEFLSFYSSTLSLYNKCEDIENEY